MFALASRIVIPQHFLAKRTDIGLSSERRGHAEILKQLMIICIKVAISDPDNASRHSPASHSPTGLQDYIAEHVCRSKIFRS